MLVIQDNLYTLLVAKNRKVFNECIKMLTDKENDMKILLYALQKIMKPSTIDSKLLFDKLIRQIWEKFSLFFNDRMDLMKKHLNRIPGIITKITPEQ